ADGDRLDVHAPAPSPARLHPGGTPHRHAQAPRRHLGLRGLEAAPGPHHRGRRPARRREPRGGRGHGACAGRIAFRAVTEIGASLREARMRAGLDITEVERVTKIRTKYL